MSIPSQRLSSVLALVFFCSTVAFALLYLNQTRRETRLRADVASLGAAVAPPNPSQEDRRDLRASQPPADSKSRKQALAKAIDVLRSQISLDLEKDPTYADRFLKTGARRLVKSLCLDAATEIALYKCVRDEKETIDKLNSLSWVDDDIIEERVGAQSAESAAAVRQLLGDKYAAYKDLEDAYEMTDALDQRLKPEARLSDEQADRLARLIQRIYQDNPGINAEDVTTEAEAEANRRALKLREDLIDEEAATFLSPEQVTAIFPFREP